MENTNGMIYIPEINLYLSTERSHLSKSWNDTHSALALEGKRMPTIEEFRNTLRYLKNSSDQQCQELYREITEVRNPERGIWLDAYFSRGNDGLYLLTRNRIRVEKLEVNGRMENLQFEIHPFMWLFRGNNLDSWIESKDMTSQGLPHARNSLLNFYYLHPVEGRVAFIGATSLFSALSCSGSSTESYQTRGVFSVVDAGQK